MVSYCIDEMEGFVFGNILGAIVVDSERKGGIVGGVASEASGVFHGLVAVRG